MEYVPQYSSAAAAGHKTQNQTDMHDAIHPPTWCEEEQQGAEHFKYTWVETTPKLASVSHFWAITFHLSLSMRTIKVELHEDEHLPKFNPKSCCICLWRAFLTKIVNQKKKKRWPT